MKCMIADLSDRVDKLENPMGDAPTDTLMMCSKCGFNIPGDLPREGAIRCLHCQVILDLSVRENFININVTKPCMLIIERLGVHGSPPTDI